MHPFSISVALELFAAHKWCRVARLRERASELLTSIPNPQVRCEYTHSCAGVWVGAQVDPLVVFVGVVSELGWG